MNSGRRGTKWKTRRLMARLIVTGVVLAGRPASAGEADKETIQHVRTSNASIRALIYVASTQSSTFRDLIQDINAMDGIVYVESGECHRGPRACLVSVWVNGRHRFLRVHVNVRSDDWDVMGSIGHELRHAIEVLGSEAVTSTAGLIYFYRHTEATGGVLTPFETDAAVQAGDAVRSEVRRYRKANIRQR